MNGWTLHFINANGQLDGLVEPISDGIMRAKERIEAVLEPVVIDIVVQVWPDRVIKQMGFAGFAPTGDMARFTFDPGNPNLRSNLGEPLERMVAHELHHVVRTRGPGYEATLGEALVSEGLAGRFCEQLYASPPEPWERVLDANATAKWARRADDAWSDAKYDHGSWFFGGNDIPHWAGYSLGYALVGRRIANGCGETAASLVAADAALFQPALKELVA